MTCGRRRRGRWFRGLLWALAVGVVAAAPVVMLIVSSFNSAAPGQPTHYGFSNWSSAFENPGMRTAILNTLELGLVRTAIGLVVGIGLAWLIARTDLPGRRFFEFSMWVAFVIPSLPTTLGWILLLDSHDGAVNQVLRSIIPGLHDAVSGPLNIYGFWGIVWVHVTHSCVPMVVILLAPTFRRMATSFEEVARTCGSGRLRTAVRITLPLMAPAALSAALLSFIWSLKSFEVELLLGAPTNLRVYSTQIYYLMQD